MTNTLCKTPLYQQLHQLLRSLIASGEYSQGSQFLTEREVSARFEVSRPTANKVIASLVTEGLLEFRKGVGTFVRDGSGLHYDLQRLVSFSAKAKALGKAPSTRVLSFKTVAASGLQPEVKEALGVSSKEELFSIERVRLADGTPVILEKRFVRQEYCPQLKRKDLEGSLYEWWTQKAGLSIVGAEQAIRAVNLTKIESKFLEVTAGTAALLVLSTGFLPGDRPLWYEQTLYRSDCYEFHNRLEGLHENRPVIGAFRTQPQ